MSRRAPRSRNVLRAARFLVVLVAVTAVVVGTVAPVTVVAASAAQSATVDLSRTSGGTVQTGIAKTTLVGFTPGNIISDAVFTNKNTMTEAQIQSFFTSKVSNCQSGYVCLKDFKITSVTRPADAYCSGYTGAANESAARIIYRVAQSCNINPQVLIVMLQKEQGLITHTWPSSWRYDIALGQGCPDTAPCDPNFVGFFHQIYGAARQMQIYMEGKWFTWYAPGKTWNVLYNPNHSCGSSPVYIANKATAALYYYTPYQPNAAALRAGYGEGNGCSAYGNRNFYNYFTDWFGSTQSSYCAPPNGGTAPATLAYVVTSAATSARSAPREECDTGVEELSEGDTLQALSISGSGLWLEVRTEVGNRWLPREDVRKSTAAEAECTIASGVSAAKRSYTITTTTTARLAPRDGCALASAPLEAGSTVAATAVSGSGLWLKVVSTYGVRWILRADTRIATSAEAACAYPTNAIAAKYGYVITANTALRDLPSTSCSASVGTLAAGEAVQAVEAVDGWLKVVVGETERWIERTSTRRATAAESACILPAGIGSAKLAYVTTSALTARAAPHADCAVGAESISAGTVLTAEAVTSDGAWLKVNLGASQKWIPRTDVRKATESELACALPLDTKTAKLTYTVTASTTGRVAPNAGCADGSSDVAVGQVFTATAVTAAGDWLKTSLAGKETWIPRADVRKATSAELACALPQDSRSAFKSYVVLGGGAVARLSPNVGCNTSSVPIAAGTVVAATAVTTDGNWLKVSLSGGAERWIPRDDVRYATATDTTCVAPTGTTAAKLWYTTTAATATRLTPSTSCTSNASTLAKDTIVEAVALSSDGQWLKVRIGADQRWVLRSDLQKVQTATTTTSLNLRSSPSTSASAIATLATGTVVAVLSGSGEWWQVKTRAGTGWVNSAYLR